MKKAVVILGSPRRSGNSATLARRAMEGIEAAGGQCEAFVLDGMDIRPCRACDACQRHPENRCVQRDDMHRIYGALDAADAVLLAAPIYMFSVSAQLKLFLDRTYAALEVFKGKRVGIVLTYADDDEIISGAVHAMGSLKDLFAYAEAQIAGIVHASAADPGEVVSNARAMDEAFELGKKLVE